MLHGGDAFGADGSAHAQRFAPAIHGNLLSARRSVLFGDEFGSRRWHDFVGDSKDMTIKSGGTKSLQHVVYGGGLDENFAGASPVPICTAFLNARNPVLVTRGGIEVVPGPLSE